MTILVAIMLMGGRAQNKDLYDFYDPKIVAKGLKILSDTGYATKITGGWQLTQGGQQLALYFQQPSAIEEKVGETPILPVDNPVDNFQDGQEIIILEDQQNTAKVGKTPIFSTKVGNSPTFAPTTTTVNNRSIKSKEFSSSSSQEVGKNPTFPENKKILKKAGVGEPKRTQLANLPHVTPDYLQAHITVWGLEEDPRKRGIGLLIFKIQNADPAPDMPDICECGETYENCQCPQRYIRDADFWGVDH